MKETKKMKFTECLSHLFVFIKPYRFKLLFGILMVITAQVTFALNPTVEGMMSKDIVIANEELSINDAARVMFRLGISRLPVTDENKKVLGIITNTDILRSHIERSTPEKVNQFRKTLEQLYGIKQHLIKKKWILLI